MLRIAVVTRYFPSSAEPWQGRSAYQTLRLLARQADVQVFYPKAVYPGFIKPRIESHRKLEASDTALDVKASYYNFHALPLIRRPINGWMAGRAVLPDVRTFAPDLILSFFLYPDGYAALKIGQKLGVPVVAMSIGSDINRRTGPVSAHHTRRVLREADYLLTVSEDLRINALALGASPQKSRTVLNGCDASVFHVRDRKHARQQLCIDRDAHVVVYVGRIDVRKGLRELVEAAVNLHNDRGRLQIYLVGDGPDKLLIERAINQNHAGSYVNLRPACSFDEVPVWMAAADVITLPSYMEGCPNVVLEALACGRPVVASKVGGIPEIMSDADGKLVPPRNSGALADALGSVLDMIWNPQVLSLGRSRGWDAVAEEMMEVFEMVVRKRRSSRICS